MLSPTLTTIRLFLHVLAAAIWVGGQFALAGMVPGLRKVGPDATKAAANGFARLAWPAFAVAFGTGIWNMLAAGTELPAGYNAVLGIKILLVVVAGVSAFAHAASENRAVKAMTGAVGAIIGVVILFLGVLLVSHG
jgi:putative copper export protein